MEDAGAFAALRARWNGRPGGGAPDAGDPAIARAIARLDATAQGLLDSYDRAAGRTALWHDLGPGTSDSGALTGSHLRLNTLARAYTTPGARHAGDPALLATLLDGLDWLYAHEYNEGKALRGNWWDWEIGAPLALVDTTMLLYDRLGAPRIADYMRAVHTFTPLPDRYFSGRGPTTGANRVWKAAVVALRGAIVGDGAQLALARDSLGVVFPYVTQGDGFRADGSFLQHDRHPYTGGYGVSLLTELGNLLYLLDGSPWAVTDPAWQNLIAMVYRAFAPLIYRGALMDLARGREVARPGMQDHAAGHAAIGAILTLAQVAPPADAAAFRGMVKGWLLADSYRDFFATAPLHLLPLARAIVDDPAVAPRAELVASRQFAGMDRAVHRRPGFALSVAMSSERVYGYESINGEHPRGWFTGDGMTALYNDDLGQFSGDFWPTVDPYRLPGTTVEARRREDGAAQSRAPGNAWAGGATLRDRYGVAGQELRPVESGLVARKSWFLLDEAIVALGAGIACAGGHAVETIVENRKLRERGDNALLADGAALPATLGWSAELAGVTWLHLEGAGGYVFPGGAPLRGRREARTGSWCDINRAYETPPVTRNYLTLWFDHGRDPRDATYAYILLPNQSPAATRDYSARPGATILRNTAALQAIRAPGLGLVAANFWQPGTVAGLRAGTPLALLAQEEGGVLTLALADPTQRQERLTLDVDRPAQVVIAADPTVRIIRLAPTMQLEVSVGGTRGATQTIALALGS